jgi:N6-L-threonylcarbamoyladenine synthase
METNSQIAIHNKTWWVVPEVAAREHSNNIFEVLTSVLEQTWYNLNDIDYIGVTTNPGLLPSLLTWTTVAWTISTVLKKQIIEINHIEAHIFSNFLEREESDINFPLVCLTVSWWHNDIYYMNSMFYFNKLWESLDDASWEAFDKAAKMMWLEYPWWPIISKLSAEYQKKWLVWKNLFPRVWLVKREFNFSLSWLKSSFKREVDNRIKQKWRLSLEDKRELSYEFELAIIEVLAWKIIYAAKLKGVQTILLAWWVSANNRLKEEIYKLCLENNFNFIYPKQNLYCMDNAAMVGINTYYKIKYNKYKEKVWMVKI